MVATCGGGGGVVLAGVVVACDEGEGEPDADESDRRNGRVARLPQTRSDGAKGVDLGTTINNPV